MAAGRSSRGVALGQSVGGDPRAALSGGRILTERYQGCSSITAWGRPGSVRVSRTRTVWSSRLTGVPNRCWPRRWCCAAAAIFPASKSISAGCARWSSASIMRDWAKSWLRKGVICARSRQRRCRVYTRLSAKVRRWSTIRVLKRSYSVPARLIGERVRVTLYHDHLEVYFARQADRAPAAHPRHSGRRASTIAT